MALDYYEILGISPGASSDEIKKAYRKLAVLYHPDRNPDPKVAERFKEITEAYNTLGDDESRRIYDLRFSTAFQEAVSAEPEVRHRDPRYRGRKAGQVRHDKWTMKDLVHAGIAYTRYCCYVGLLISFLLAVDYLLPYRTFEEKVADVYRVQLRRSAYTVIKTVEGRSLKAYGWSGSSIDIGDPIFGEVTPILSIPMRAGNSGDYYLRMGYLYRSLVFFPIVLLIFSILGVLRPIGVETNFNFGIGAGLFVLIHVYLILSS